MRPQGITRVVDALVNQQRIILWLACGHKRSVDAREVRMLNRTPHVGGVIDCPFCPDVPVTPKEKTATQLWREAGEP